MPEFGTRPPEKRERTELTAATTECRLTPAWQPGTDANLQRAGKQPSAATTASRDLGLILRNRNDQLVALAYKHREKETALLRVCDAVTLAEAKRMAREALDV